MTRRVDTYVEAVWHADDLTSSEKLLLLAIARHMDFNNLGGAHPGKARLQALTALSDRSVKRVLAGVIAKGWLIEVHRGGSARGSKRTASVYRGHIPDRGHGVPSTNSDRGHSDPRTGVMVSTNRGHGDPPPFQVPAPSHAGNGVRRPTTPTPTAKAGVGSTTPPSECECEGTGIIASTNVTCPNHPAVPA